MRNENYAGFWIRFVANFIDSIIIGIPVWIVSFIAGMFSIGLMSVGAEGGGIELVGFGMYTLTLIGTFVATGAYFIIMESSTKQATVGKMVVGVQVVNKDGGRMTLGNAIGRYLGKILSGILYIGYIMAGITQKKQGLHDILAGTTVVYKGSRVNGDIIDNDKL